MILVLFMAFWIQKVTDKVTPPVIRVAWTDREMWYQYLPTDPTIGHNTQQTYCKISHMEIIEKVSTSSSCLMGTFPDAGWLAVLPKYKLRDKGDTFRLCPY